MMMRSNGGLAILKAGLLVSLLLAPASVQAQAPIFAVVMQPLATVVALAGTSSLCIAIVYDKNGNRVSQTVGNVTTGATIWGSGSYGCFVWTS